MTHDDPALWQGLQQLRQALLDHPAGSAAQAQAWQHALTQLPESIRETLPALTMLHRLAEAAWPAEPQQAPAAATPSKAHAA